MESTKRRPTARLRWGRDGARRAADAGDIVVLVDTLSFSTGVATACDRGARIVPAAGRAEALRVAEARGLPRAVRREEVPEKGAYSLSPGTLAGLGEGETLVVSSPNGATCTRRAAHAPWVLIGCLANRSAVARYADELRRATGLGVSVVACGERHAEPGEDGELRVAFEDLLGAGAILDALGEPRGFEAEVAVTTFRGTAPRLGEVLEGLISGVELVERGFADDVRRAAALDSLASVPVLEGDALVPRGPAALGREVRVRAAGPADREALLEVHRAAFGGEVEPDLVASLLAGGFLPGDRSLVAVAGAEVLGHVALSPVSGPGDVALLALAPVGVRPDAQGAGIGGALLRCAVAAARREGARAIALLGDPGYYRRFGFVPAAPFGVAPPAGDFGDAFQVHLLGNEPPPAGRLTYPAPFDPLW